MKYRIMHECLYLKLRWLPKGLRYRFAFASRTTTSTVRFSEENIQIKNMVLLL